MLGESLAYNRHYDTQEYSKSTKKICGPPPDSAQRTTQGGPRSESLVRNAETALCQGEMFL